MRQDIHLARLARVALLAGPLLAGCSSSGSGDAGGLSFASILGTAAIEQDSLSLAENPGGLSEPVKAPDVESEAPATRDDAAPAESAESPSREAAAEPEESAAVLPPTESQDPVESAESPPPSRKKSLLSAFWSGGQATTKKPAVVREAAAATATRSAPARAAEAKPRQTSSLARNFRTGEDALPGVRTDQLFEITRKSGLDDDRDIDLNEDDGVYRVASAAGLARLAPNGLLRQREDVDVTCLKPALVGVLRSVERRFGKKVIVTSGYRSPAHNKRVRGAPKSYHMACAAADIQVPGVSKWDLAQFVRSLPGRGGVGTYCHTASVHVDVGPERDWNWRCRRKA